MAVDMLAPAAYQRFECRSGNEYQSDSARLVNNVANGDVMDMLNMGCLPSVLQTGYVWYTAPIAAELVSINAAAVAANGARTIAGQPDYPRTLQIRQVIVTAITAGILTLVGVNNLGETITKEYSLVASSTRTVVTNEAWARVTSATVSGLVGGGDGTLGIGVGAALGLPLPPGFAGLSVFKTNVNNANEAVAGVDTVAGTVSPTSAANASRNFGFYYRYGVIPS